MARNYGSYLRRKHLSDLLAGTAVFALLVGLMGWHVGIAWASDGSISANMDRNASAILLAGSFAAMTVFNVAFLRHLCRAYAGPRKDAARRADQSIPREKT